MLKGLCVKLAVQFLSTLITLETDQNYFLYYSIKIIFKCP